MTTLIVLIVIVLVVIAVAAFLVIRKKNREADAARADQLRTQAATQAQSTIPPAKERAASAEAEAERARAVAAQAEAEAHEARLAAQQVEASHESQVRAADRLDPRVDHKADDYEPQVAGTADQAPARPSEVDVDTEVGTTHEATPTRPVETPVETHDETHDETYDETPVEPHGSTVMTAPESTDAAPDSDQGIERGTGRTPLLPRRTPGAQEMPGKPIEQTDGGGGWFTKGSDPGRS
ncbi:hypothetical protein GCM10023339_03990 [Alloalcanivorax gelatiniphagus]